MCITRLHVTTNVVCLMLSGGSVISVRCSETYEHKTALVSLWKIPLWYVVNSPRTVIQVKLQHVCFLQVCDEYSENCKFPSNSVKVNIIS